METKQVEKPSVINVSLAKKMALSLGQKVTFDSTRSKIEFRQQDRKKGRMKVTLKFGTEEAEGFTNFCRLAKPEKMAEDDFVKFIFYKGVEALQMEFAARIEEFKKNNPEEFAKMQAEVEAVQTPQEGSITIAGDTQTP